MKLAVVIPYFQRQPGLLQACVRSVMDQEGVPSCQVIVVDDASPLPASQELASLLAAHPTVQIVTQANAGPGAARNRGLDCVEQGTEVVAFLDSDDVWAPGYARAALQAFASGCDMYFANSRRYSAEESRFDWTDPSGRRLEPAHHTVIDADQGLYVFDGDFFDFAVYRSGIISTSTLAYRYARLPHLRFNTLLFNGQDRFFKLQLAQAARLVAFCTRVGATEGQGVNIFDSAQWGSIKGLTLLSSYIRLSKLILSDLSLSPPQQAFVRGQLDRSRYSFAVSAAHLLRSGVGLPGALVRSTVASDPATGLLFLPNLVRAAVRKLSGRG